MSAEESKLPIVDALPQIRASLRANHNLVLQAPPGAGKSTRVPLELLREPWAEGRRILMLEPRRLATRAVAQRMAETLGEAVGRTVGYRMRLDTRVSSATRIEVVTEGVLGSILQRDPALEDVACVIFDEFHERSLQADLGLALALDVQAHLNEQLRLVVMSATLDAEPIAALLRDAGVVRTQGRSFPVDVEYMDFSARAAGNFAALTRAVVAAVRKGAEQPGDMLVFLPGAAEIRRAQGAIQDAQIEAGLQVLPLFGDLSQAEQDRALRPSEDPRRRKVVLATNIAETSLTIEGVRTVVDCGLERRSRFDPVSGMNRLETRRISRASAEQRAGRAGRLGPGRCLRLWSEGSQRSLEAHAPAEILETDLAPLALDLAGWNVAQATQLAWLDAPPSAPLAQANDLLSRLGALDASGRITPHGRAMLELRLHPRLAHMMLRSRALDLETLACDVAALLAERDILRSRPGERQSDLRVRLEALRRPTGDVDRAAVERVRRSSAQYRRLLGAGDDSRGDSDQMGVLLAFAYPDRIARRRKGDERAEGGGRYLLSSGRGARFDGPQALARSEFLVIPEVDAGEREARIFAAAPLSLDDLEEHFADELRERELIAWDSRERAVVATRSRNLGALVIESRPLTKPPADAVVAAMIDGVRELSLAALPWNRETREWQQRLQFVRSQVTEKQADWPDVSDAALLERLPQWLGPYLNGITRADHLARVDLAAALHAQLDWKQGQRLEQIAPTHLDVPSGSRIRVEYDAADGLPTLSVRLQEVFGWKTTPLIAGVPVVLKLLSPAHRPVQVTRDLGSFWSSGYIEVRKELKGRYPKHYWPEDPLQAVATRGARRKPPAGRTAK